MVCKVLDHKAGLRQKREVRLLCRSRIISGSFIMRLVQFRTPDGSRAVAALEDDGRGKVIAGVTTTFELANRAIAGSQTLEEAVERLGYTDCVDIRAALAE